MDTEINDLKSQILLKSLDDSELKRIAGIMQTIKVQKGEHVFREEESCSGIYMIRSGRIEVSKITADGWKQTLVMLNPGNFLGEIALLERTVHATDASALESSELILFPKGAFEGLLDDEPHLMLKVVKNIAIVAALNVRRMNEKFLKVLVNY